VDLPRLLAPTGAAALLAAAVVALAPAASATTAATSSALPPAAAVVPVLADGTVTVTASAGTGSAPSTTATASWTIPACSGTVYALFVLHQGGAGGTSAYVQEKGATPYPCRSSAQVVSVRYHAADPSQGVLTTSDVQLSTTTYATATGGDAVSSTTTTARAVASAKGLPRASSVVPRFVQGVVLHADASSPTGVSAAARWVVPACTGTVRATFTLFQDGEASPRAAQGQAPAVYPCSPADQVVTVQYRPTGPSAPAVHPGTADVWVDTVAGRSGGRVLQSAGQAATVS
jgi:hypothetical protein